MDHPEGLDPPFGFLFKHCSSAKKFAQIEAKAGDVFITHGLLPHSHSPNYLHYARVITNPHVNMARPHNLNRPDGNYVSCVDCLTMGRPADTYSQTLAEQVILRALGRDSVPEFKPTRPRITFYPRTAYFKREKVKDELDRMIAAAKARGLTEDSIDSVYLKGEEAIAEHEKRNGYDKTWGPNGVASTMGDNIVYVPNAQRHVLV